MVCDLNYAPSLVARSLCCSGDLQYRCMLVTTSSNPFASGARVSATASSNFDASVGQHGGQAETALSTRMMPENG